MDRKDPFLTFISLLYQLYVHTDQKEILAQRVQPVATACGPACSYSLWLDLTGNIFRNLPPVFFYFLIHVQVSVLRFIQLHFTSSTCIRIVRLVYPLVLGVQVLRYRGYTIFSLPKRIICYQSKSSDAGRF